GDGLDCALAQGHVDCTGSPKPWPRSRLFLPVRLVGKAVPARQIDQVVDRGGEVSALALTCPLASGEPDTVRPRLVHAFDVKRAAQVVSDGCPDLDPGP